MEISPIPTRVKWDSLNGTKWRNNPSHEKEKKEEWKESIIFLVCVTVAFRNRPRKSAIIA